MQPSLKRKERWIMLLCGNRAGLLVIYLGGTLIYHLTVLIMCGGTDLLGSYSGLAGVGVLLEAVLLCKTGGWFLYLNIQR